MLVKSIIEMFIHILHYKLATYIDFFLGRVIYIANIYVFMLLISHMANIFFKNFNFTKRGCKAHALLKY